MEQEVAIERIGYNWKPDRAYYFVSEVAQLLGVSRQTVYKFEKDGKMEFRKLSDRTIIMADSLLQFMNNLEKGPSSRSK